MASEEQNFNINDLNLDFLELTPPNATNLTVYPAIRCATPLAFPKASIGNVFKARQLAQRVADCDSLVKKTQQMETLKQQLNDFQESAKEIRKLYESERESRKELELKANQLQERCDQLDAELVQRILQGDQLQAQLDDLKGPFNYTDLALKYLKLAQKMDDENSLYWQEKSVFNELSKYCENKGRNVPVLKSPKKRVRPQKYEKAIQCLILEDPQEPPLKEFTSRSTQCERVEIKSQGTQHISTTTTRSTSTTCFIKQHNVGTNFPEPTTLPPITKMLEEILLFNDISPLSPISDLQSPPPPDIEPNKEPDVKSIACRSVGTCTFLCNVQRSIDFLPSARLNCSHSQSQINFSCENVKHEAASTPCPSPPPLTPNHEAMPTSNKVKQALNRLPELAEIPPDMFTTIWQMAGQMFMGLLYTPSGSRTYISASGTSESIKQEEFHNWLFSLYESVQQKSQESWQSTQIQEHLLPPVNISAHMHSDMQSIINQGDSGSKTDIDVTQNLNNYTTNETTSPNENMLDFDIVKGSSTEKDSLKSNKLTLSTFKEPQQVQQKSAMHGKVKSRKTSKRYKKNKLKKISGKSDNPCPLNKNYMKCNCENLNNTNCISCETKTETKCVQNTELNYDKRDFITAVEFCAELYSHTKEDYDIRTDDEIKHVPMIDLNVDKFLKEDVEGNDKTCESSPNSQAQTISVVKNIFKDVVRNEIDCIDRSSQTKAKTEANDVYIDKHEYLSTSIERHLFGSDSECENECNINAKLYNINTEYGSLLCETIQENDNFDENEIPESVLVIDETVIENNVSKSCNLHKDTADTKINKAIIRNEVELKDSKSDMSEIIGTATLNEIILSDSTNKIFNDILSECHPNISNSKSSVREERKRKSDIKALHDNCSTLVKAKQSKLENVGVKDYNTSEERAGKEIVIVPDLSGQLSSEKMEAYHDHLQTCDNTANEYIQAANVFKCEKTLISEKVKLFTDVTTKENTLKIYANNILTAKSNKMLDASFTQYSIINTDNLEKQKNCENIQNLENTKSDHVCSNNTLYDSPASPISQFNNITDEHTSMVPCIPLDLDQTYFSNKSRTLIDHLINCYSTDAYKIVTGKRSGLVKEECEAIETQIKTQLVQYFKTPLENINVEAVNFSRFLQSISENCDSIASAIVEQMKDAPRPQDELACSLDMVPPKYVGSHLKLILAMLNHFQRIRPCCVSAVLTKIESTLFRYQTINTNSVNVVLNLIQLYLLVIPIHFSTARENPARLLIAKILYYYNLKAIPMIYEVLCHYPTTLPHREERSYDRSDALITVIQHILMCTTYNMESSDLRTKELLSMLRFQYHFEPFKPTATDVLNNLVAKLKAGKLVNLKYAFAVFCKRQRAVKVINDVLQMQLIPLVNEYYHLMQHTCDYDERVATLLDSISMIIKPFPLDTNISIYLSIFHRFLNAVERPVVQEAAVMAILRMQRFGHIQCFRALSNYSPSYKLQPLTKNALKTFVHRKPLSTWTDLLKENKCT